MFLIIALILLLLWIAGLGLAVAGSLIHILLVLAIIAIAWHFLSGRSSRSI
jgi:hypothetical protein